MSDPFPEAKAGRREIVLSAFQDLVERATYKLEGRQKHCARSAYRHLRRAARIYDIAPEMAVFGVITAEEEAATAIMYALKEKKYAGSEHLDPWNHRHKAVIAPFLEFTASFFGEIGVSTPRVSISRDEKKPTITIQIDMNEILGRSSEEPLFGEPTPPLNFAMQDQDGPLNLAKKFAEFSRQKNKTDVFEFVKAQANFRNELLYASDRGIARTEVREDFFQLKTNWITVLFVILLLIEQSDECQLFVAQCLDALLVVLRKLNAPQFSFEMPIKENFNGIFVERIGDQSPTVQFKSRRVVRVDFTYYWLPVWKMTITPNTTSR